MNNFLGQPASSNSKIPAWYQVPTTTLGANAAGTFVLQTDGDSIFELDAFMGSSSADAATDFSPNNFTVKIQILSSNRNLTNVDIPQRILCPAQLNPYRLRCPIQFQPNSQFQFSFLNLTAGNLDISFALVGYRIYGTGMIS